MGSVGWMDVSSRHADLTQAVVRMRTAFTSLQIDKPGLIWHKQWTPYNLD